MGPSPNDEGGVPYAATLLLEGLAGAGVEVDCFVATDEADLPQRLLRTEGLRFFCEPPRWRQGAWYSRTAPLSGVEAPGSRPP